MDDDISKTKYGSSSHQVMKDKAKQLVDDLQGIFSKLQSARNESRTNDIVFFEAKMHLMLQEWKTELNKPSPASSLGVCIYVDAKLIFCSLSYCKIAM